MNTDSKMERLLKIADVRNMIGFGTTQIYEWVGTGRFPQPIKANGSRGSRWVMSEVQEWIADQVKQNRQ